MATRHPLCQVLNEQPENDEPQADETFDENTAEEPEVWQFEPAICG